MPTAQPKWKQVWATDSSALYVDRTGAYDPELLVAQEDESRGVWIVFRFPLPRLKVAGGYLVPASYEASWPHPLPNYQEWFATSLDDVARSTGTSTEELVRLLTSKKPNDRANAYEQIGGYHGFENLDGYPEEMTEAELGRVL